MSEYDKEVNDALHCLLHWSLFNKEFTTQKEQFNIVHNHIKKLRLQLKAYKDKEDKLREYIKNIKSSCVDSHFDAVVIKANILQILNKGDK